MLRQERLPPRKKNYMAGPSANVWTPHAPQTGVLRLLPQSSTDRFLRGVDATPPTDVSSHVSLNSSSYYVSDVNVAAPLGFANVSSTEPVQTHVVHQVLTSSETSAARMHASAPPCAGAGAASVWAIPGPSRAVTRSLYHGRLLWPPIDHLASLNAGPPELAPPASRLI